MDDSGNNVWQTIRDLGNAAISQYANIVGIQANEAQTIAQINANAYTAINGRAAAAPSGYVGQWIPNPPPGSFGAYPQAQGKPIPGEGSAFVPLSDGSNSTLIMAAIVAVVVGLLFLLSRR